MRLEKLLKELGMCKDKCGNFIIDITEYGKDIEKHLKDYQKLKDSVQIK